MNYEMQVIVDSGVLWGVAAVFLLTAIILHLRAVGSVAAGFVVLGASLAVAQAGAACYFSLSG